MLANANLKSRMYVDDTIVAPATAPGRGAIAIVRLSGPRAIQIARSLWHPIGRNYAIAPRRLFLGEIRDPDSGVALDRALFAQMPGPSSVTGEDVAELHCHGGVYLVRRIVALAAAAGARMAEPGEFSRRAFLNGRIDLTEAEAIADLIAARGETALRQAVAQLGGALAERVGAMRARVIAIRAHLEAEIDFADEDIALPSRGRMAADIERLRQDVALLHDSFARGRIVREGARVAIIGKPNAGKSSVLNLLTGGDRAIVTSIPGTTRDVIEETIHLGPLPVVLQDTAGVRESLDEIERIGIARTRRHAAEADLLIAVFDRSRPLEPEDSAVIALTVDRPGVALLNKSDLPAHAGAGDLVRAGLELSVLQFSTVTGQGAHELRDRIATQIERVEGGSANEVAISRERHREALGHALDALGSAERDALAAMPLEIVALNMALAADALASITGQISTEDVLDAVFREFCIGK